MASKKHFYERVGKRIKEIREECGITLPELSAECGIGENILELIEGGRRDIKVGELYEISRALNVRISSFLNPCDYKLYEKRKEELIDRYIPLKRLSQILNIGDSAIRELCKNDEIPYLRIYGKYFFRASEINEWLEHHCGVKKKIREDQSKRFRIYGIEPLISAKEAGEILGCSWHFVFSLKGTVPYFKIGGRVKFRLYDIENYRDRKKIEPWEISTKIGKWKSSFVWPEPSSEEKMVKEASWERGFKEDARPGYIVKDKSIASLSFEDLKQEVQEFIDKNIPVKSNLLGCSYYVIQKPKCYGCILKWWGLPEGRENYRVHSTGLSSDSPDKLREKVDRIRQKIPKEDLIDIDYYSWRFSFSRNQHCARVTYYLLKRNTDNSADFTLGSTGKSDGDFGT